ncbi:sigma-70 family RNA polymerase sigma factor [Paenibacillus sp. GSMTC-2017]|uniref:RNA polymerase sigma factor n=1 Tax=Paenibacillus sp. GSMTC-2017 TaxID=2794350 RepID=UPI0018D9CA43|nr:sigma-70 family RNA polymerase sigma factor [Paenibacillus sp. GSMTC-2017]MBH5319054.1 sigma-70 family RNA polymerase sigma factor [Paenibacillus sp. GSMTC-2017]
MREKSTQFNNSNMRSEAEIIGLQGALFRYCLMLTGSNEDAEDLSQDTWIRAIKGHAIWSHINPEAYLLRIAKNRWVDICRRNKMLDERLANMSVQEEQLQNGALEIETIFQSIFHHQSPVQRSVFVLREVLGYSIAETSILLGTTEGSVKSALFRARQTLRDVRYELEQGESERNEDIEQRELLRQLANAYVQGDNETLIRLLQQGQSISASTVTAIGFTLKSNDVHRFSTNQTFLSMQMAV